MKALHRAVYQYDAGPFFRVFHHTAHSDPQAHFSYRGETVESDDSHACATAAPCRSS
jgi:hypothetical protein